MAESPELPQLPEVVWRPSFSASCIYLAEMARRGALDDVGLAVALAPAMELLTPLPAALGVAADDLWEILPARAGELQSNAELARRTLAKLSARVSSAAVERLAAAIGAVERAVDACLPDLSRQLELRQGPLAEQWEARGPGLLRYVAHRLPALLPPRAVIDLVHPVGGGGGKAFLLYNTVRLEALLYHPVPSIPETARLAWLILQLQSELPVLGEQVAPRRLPTVAALAAAPLTLEAAQAVELIGPQVALSDVLSAWELAPPSAAASLGGQLEQWWIESRPLQRWAPALGELDSQLDSQLDAQVDSQREGA